MVDDPTPKDDPIDEAAQIISRFGEETERRMNKILDERLKVEDPEPPNPDKENDPKDPENDPDNDPEPKEKSLAQKLGF